MCELTTIPESLVALARSVLNHCKLEEGFGIGDGAEILSDTMYLLISFRKSTPPQHRQLNILISNSK